MRRTAGAVAVVLMALAMAGCKPISDEACGVPGPIWRFIGQAEARDGDVVRFVVVEVGEPGESGPDVPLAVGDSVAVDYGDDAGFLELGVHYAVLAWDQRGALGGNVDRVGEDCASTTYADGRAIDTRVEVLGLPLRGLLIGLAAGLALLFTARAVQAIRRA